MLEPMKVKHSTRLSRMKAGGNTTFSISLGCSIWLVVNLRVLTDDAESVVIVVSKEA